MMDSLTLVTHSAEDTEALAAALAPACRPNDVIGLQGTLGAGKTCFVRGLARGLGVPCGAQVISPTFVLLRQYAGRLQLNHYDAYRLDGAADMEEIGSEETFADGGVTVVEWADHVAECLPAARFLLSIQVTGPSERRLALSAHGEGPQERMAEFRAALEPWLEDR
jgi:tRNA threonylcarbamoyladenosine biosynthesis protein TsaE